MTCVTWFRQRDTSENSCACLGGQLKVLAAKSDSTAKSSSTFDTIENLCRRFHLIATQLHTRHEKRVTLTIADEYDVQDLMHSLLTIYFDDVRKEEGTPSHAGKSARMDFLIKDESTVVETKMTRDGLGDKELGEELALDI